MNPVDMHLLLMSLLAIARMYAGIVQCTIRQESFQQVQERKQATWYWVYDQSFQESLHQNIIATSARSIRMRILCTIQETVVSLRKTEWRKPIFMPPRKAERNPILQSSLLRSWGRNCSSLRRQSRNRVPPRNAKGMIAISTPNRELDRVA